MLFDLETLFSDNQAVTTTAVSTNVVVGAKGLLKEIAFGTPIPLRIQVTEAFVGCTGVEFEVETATDETFTSPISLATTGTVPVADLVQGYIAPINFIPKGNKGYLRLKYTVSGTASQGKITAGIVEGNDGSFQDM